MISKRLRFAVLERDGFACRYCGNSERALEVDHVIPKSLGGQDVIANLATACVDCNRGKGAAPLNPEALRSMLKTLRPLKREQARSTVEYFTRPVLPDLSPAQDNRVPMDMVQKYMRDIGGYMGRSDRSLEEAVAIIVKKHPGDAHYINEAGMAVLRKKGGLLKNGCHSQDR